MHFSYFFVLFIPKKGCIVFQNQESTDYSKLKQNINRNSRNVIGERAVFGQPRINPKTADTANTNNFD